MSARRSDEEWEELARAVGSLSAELPYGARGGTVIARESLAAVIGESFLFDTMEVALAQSPASEMARSMLSLLRPLCVVAPLAARAGDESLDMDTRRDALDVLQVIARPEALIELHAIASRTDGELHRKASWALVQGMLGVDRPFQDETAEAEIVAHLCSVADAGVRELAEVLRDHEPRVAARDVAGLLSQLCVEEGFCLPPNCIEFLVRRPPPTVGEFVDAVFLLEGLDPETTRRSLYESVYAKVAAVYDRAGNGE